MSARQVALPPQNPLLQEPSRISTNLFLHRVFHFVISLSNTLVAIPLWKILLYIILSCTINAFIINPNWVYDVGITKSIIEMFSSSSILIRQQFLKLRGEKVRAVSTEEEIQIEDIRHNSSHIKGKHTVRLLPYATAKLNPDDERFCLTRMDSRKSDPIGLPGNKTHHEFTSRDIARNHLVDVIQDGVFVCINDEIHTKLVLKGVPPLSVYYERRVDNESVNMTIDGIGSEHFKFPIDEPDRAKLFFASDNYQWAQNQEIEVQLNMTADIPATYSLRVLEINDLLNNTHNYIIERNQNVFVKYDVFSRPTAKFSSDIPIYTRPGYPAEMKLNLQGVAPWKLGLGYWSEDIAELTDTLSSEPTEMLNVTIKENENKMGFLAPSTNILSIAYPPTVKIDAIPISAEDCPGEIGIEATLSFTGIPRWFLEYSIKSEIEKVDEIVMSEKSKRVITIKPPMPGHYEYTFFSLSDNIYREGVEINYGFTQTVYPKPNAVFRRTKDRTINSCMSNLVELDVDLSGSGPFTLEYEVMFNRRTNAFTIADIQSPSYVIISPPFDNPGTYTVTFERIVDSQGCSQILNNDDSVTINVKRDKPTVGFRNSHEILWFLEGGSVELPLQLTGNPRWDVTYIYHLDMDNARKAYDLVNPNSILTVTEPAVTNY
ncbi:unnamed protein product [Rhizophagus irregularis]|nr:unnamed protein product [Rhizophagus irregularis]